MLAHGCDCRGAYDKAVEEEGWVDKYAVDVTRYIDMHVRFSLFPHICILLIIVAGGAKLLFRYAFPSNPGKSDKRLMEA
ncbi:hypothetical protein BGW80DRAFT_1309254 [Lactifluus volemus]|nr:hypothetical protein BGW80DRAFT_1309254 [Lactifluus volemus]